MTENVISAELAYAEEEIQKIYKSPKKYQVEIPAKIKKQAGLYARGFDTAWTIKKFTTIYLKYSFVRTTVNIWKKKCNDGDWTVVKRIGRLNLLDSGMLKKAKDTALGTRMAGRVINRCQVISIATGVVRANNPNILKEYGGDLVLNDKWARAVLEKPTWSKRKGTTGKVDQITSPVFSRRKIHFSEKHISIGFWTRYLPIFDHWHRSNSHVGKYTFSFKGTKNIPIKGVDDKCQKTAAFAVSCTGKCLSIQLIMQRKPNEVYPSILFDLLFRLRSQKIIGQTQRNMSNFLNK